ncbi:MAG: phage tail protein [Alphaproteobacteria bacterium]|nr:phage tail protein [Alphaproteobacteria bacterium]
MILGDFQFNLKTMTPNTMTRSTEYNWSDTERVGDLPNLQNLGVSKDQIEIEGVFYPKFNKENSVVSGLGNSVTSKIMNFLNLSENSEYSSIEAIRSSDLCKIASNLINDNGEILGKFVISSIKETQSYFGRNGKPQKIEFTLILKRSPGATNSIAWSASENSIVDTATNIARSYLRW